MRTHQTKTVSRVHPLIAVTIVLLGALCAPAGAQPHTMSVAGSGVTLSVQTGSITLHEGFSVKAQSVLTNGVPVLSGQFSALYQRNIFGSSPGKYVQSIRLDRITALTLSSDGSTATITGAGSAVISGFIFSPTLRSFRYSYSGTLTIILTRNRITAFLKDAGVERARMYGTALVSGSIAITSN